MSKKQLYYDAITGPIPIKIVGKEGEEFVCEVTEARYAYPKGYRLTSRLYRIVRLIGRPLAQMCVNITRDEAERLAKLLADLEI